MKAKRTIKRIIYSRKTAKRYLNSGRARGGVRGKPLNPSAFEWKPPAPLNPNAVEWKPPTPLNPNAVEWKPPKAESPIRAALPNINAEALRIVDEKTILDARETFFSSLYNLKLLGAPEAKQLENAYALDCEMVGIGPLKYDRGMPYRDSTLAHVVIIDFKGKKKFDKYVIPKEGIDAITDFRTEISGIRQEMLERLNPDTNSYEKIVAQVNDILKNKIIVGHGLKSDFKVLDNYKPPVPYMVWDTAQIDKFMKNIPGYGRGARKLIEISKEFANNNIQVPGRAHNPIEDAKASMNLYRVTFGYPKLPL
jgi:RNA exonuclease 4